jgi:hypothetical protein
MGSSTLESFFLIFFACGAVFFWLVPIMVAMNRKHRNRVPIILTTVFVGWTVIGWIAAMIWASTDNVEGRKS